MKKKGLVGKSSKAAAAPSRVVYTISAAAQMTGVRPELIRYFHSRGIFTPVSRVRALEPVLDDDAIYELKRIEHYRQRFGANRSALTFISTLLREVARLEAELRFRDHL